MDGWKLRILHEIKCADNSLDLYMLMGWNPELKLQWRNFLLKELLRIQLEEFDRS